MPFDSLLFWIFLAAVWLLWLISPSALYRRVVLAAAGFVFYYLAQPTFVVLLLMVTVFTYLVGTGIQRAALPQMRQRLLWLGVGGSVLCLAIFKYAGMMGRAGIRLAEIIPGLQNDAAQFILPLGISYYIFQAIGYLVDCYRRQAPEKVGFLDYALFLSFFPHITAGPILRSADFLPQLRARARLSLQMAAPVLWESLLLITFGLFKKMVIADNLAGYVNEVFSNLASASSPQILLATYAYAAQIYCDFSGYTDVALGAALLFGLRLPANFRWPYLANSAADFWNRWHISLSHWLRDYVYFSLPGLRSGSPFAPYRNLLITMALCGLWHGAGWTFFLWGLYHGALLAAYRAGQPLWRRLKALPDWLHNLCAIIFVQQLVVAGWVLFRIEKVGDLRVYIGGLFNLDSLGGAISALSSDKKMVAGMLLLFWLGQFLHQSYPLTDYMKARPWNPWAMSLLLLLGLAIVTFKQSIAVPFLYFKF